ncbi:MAG: flavin reductase family protein [Ktedonobacterales bacterium]
MLPLVRLIVARWTLDAPESVGETAERRNRPVDVIDGNPKRGAVCEECVGGPGGSGVEEFRAIAPKILYFGTPVVLISTRNEDGSANLAPMSSAWALGYTILLGLGAAGKTAENLARTGECVLNLPPEDLWPAVEKLASLTGKSPVPDYKVSSAFRYERDKFGAAGLTPLPSDCVAPPRVAECPLHLEALVRDIRPLHADSTALVVEVEVVRVHARGDIMHGERHISPTAWRPLIYNFRHYFGLGRELGKSFRAET